MKMQNLNNISTHLIGTEIFDKLNINIKSVLNDSKKNVYIW